MNRKFLGTMAGASALGIGIGLQRTQFGVLGELMAKQNWFPENMIGTLAGVSLVGYIVGCIHQTSIRNEFTNIRVVRIGLALAVMSFFIEPLINNDSWQVMWRLIGGWASAQLVTGVPGLGIRHHKIDDRRRALAFIFAGAGFAALAGSVILSLIKNASVVQSWVTTGLIAVVLAIPIHILLDICIEEELVKKMATPATSGSTGEPASSTPSIASGATKVGWSQGLRLLAASTFFFGAGQVTVLTYYPLFLIKRFAISEAAAESSFALVGLGYTLGALATGFVPQRWRTDTLMTLSAGIGVIGTAICAASTSVPMAGLGGFTFAVWNGSMMGLLLHRINQSVREQDARKTWSQFSLVLSVGFLGFSFLSAAIEASQVAVIIWCGALLGAVHLVLQMLAKRQFVRQLSASQS